MKKIILTKLEKKVLYLCDDDTGLPELLAKELSISKEEVLKIIDYLIKLGFVKKEFHGKWDWSVSTQDGRDYLNKR